MKDGDRRELNPAWVLALAVAVGLVIVLLLVWKPASKAPYSPAAVAPQARLEIVKPADAQAAVDRLAGPGRIRAPADVPGVDEEIVGQLTFVTPKNAPHDGQYALFVIDNDRHRCVAQMWASGPVGTDVGEGWDSRFDEVAKRYDWLAPLASGRQSGSSAADPGTAVMFLPDAHAPINFLAVPAPGTSPIKDPGRRLTVALVFIGSDGHVYWATRVPS